MTPEPEERKPGGTVGVYDRPAHADRPPWLARAVIGVVAAAAAVGSWWYFWPAG